MNQYCDRLKLGVKTFFRPTVTFSSASSSSSSVAYLSTTLFVVLLFLHSSIAAETASEIDETKMASSSTLSLPSAQFALSLYDILKREKGDTRPPRKIWFLGFSKELQEYIHVSDTCIYTYEISMIHIGVMVNGEW